MNTTVLNYASIPKDSVIRQFVAQYAHTEVPLNFLVTIGLSCVGVMLRRDVWIHHMSENTLIYPNLSVLLVGHSGCGKDTCIGFGQDWLGAMGLADLLLGGRTIEGIYQQLLGRGDPAIGYLSMGELTATIGTKDYQQGLIQGLTDLMSNLQYKNVSTKTDKDAVIHKPTLTVHAGSTVEWLHKAMPDGALEGGFLGRFLLAIRTPTDRMSFHALPAYEQQPDPEYRKLRKEAHITCNSVARQIMIHCKGKGNIILATEAQDLYNNWYHNRFRYFSKAATPYANRSRDIVLKIALISSQARGRSWIDAQDIQLGIAILHDSTTKIDAIIAPPTREGQCSNAILGVLPATRQQIFQACRLEYQYREIQSALDILEQSGEITKRGEQWQRIALPGDYSH